ncbi:ArsR/SmtB family transcription factor [Corynebacterium halotolerans]|uniref:ArsR/SmtB family transcription factor n=1 Tax=Corynebacterium halotolerans TaxID=225326 RepID=UPI003CF98DCE
MFSSEQLPLYERKANLFKGLAHPYRVRVLEILSAAPEASVSELLADTGLEASHLSQHLAVLRKYGLVVSERRANIVHYRLAHSEVADLLQAARQLLTGMLHVSRKQLDSLENLPGIAGRR